MFKQAKGFILGFASCVVILSLAMSVFAAPISRKIEVFYNNIKIISTIFF